MPKPFDTLIYYPDGAPPETAHNEPRALSQRWLAVCAGLLAEHGPVFKHNMGSTLSHFDIEMGGPLGRLAVHRTPCFEFWISLGRGTAQDKATVSHFVEFHRKACAAANSSVQAEALTPMRDLHAKPALIMFDYCNPQIEQDQRAAIAQLGLHLADAYFEYCEPGQPTD
jgi:hypothetical protein